MITKDFKRSLEKIFINNIYLNGARRSKIKMRNYYRFIVIRILGFIFLTGLTDSLTGRDLFSLFLD